MTPQELRSSILQLAIQGKLVEQRPEEGTGEDLFRQIQAEKQALIKSGILKKTKPLPIITDELFPYNVPKTWFKCYIDDIAFVTKLAGFEYTKYIAPNLVKEGIPLFKGKNVQNGEVVLNFESYIPERISNELPRSQICKKCLLTPYVGTIGNIAIFNGEFRAHLGSNVGKIELLNGKLQFVSEEYVLYYLKCAIGYLELTKYKKATAQESISIDAIRNVIIPLPPLAEQKRIVAKIEELLPLVDRYEQAWQRLEVLNSRFPVDMQKSVLNLAIQGKLVPQRPEEGTAEDLFRQIQSEKQALIKAGKIKKEKPLPEITEDEISFDIPESWKWVRLSELMYSISTGPFGSMLHKADYVSDGIPLVNPANIVNGRIVPSEKMMITPKTRDRLSSYILRNGMIVMGRRGEMGRCAVVTDLEDGWLCGTGSFFMEPSIELFVNYLSLFFRTPFAKAYLGGESVGTTMNNLNHKILRNLPVPLPPLAEQKRIVARLEELLPLCEKLR